MSCRQIAYKAIRFTLLAIWIIIIIIPIYWMMATSFKFPKDMISMSSAFVFRPTLKWYRLGLLEEKFLESILDSVIIAIGSTGLCLLLAIPVAYALSRFWFRGRDKLALFLLTFSMIPHLIIAFPMFLTYKNMDLYDTHIAVITMHALINFPFIVWLLRGFFLGMEKNLEDAALVDGCNRIGVIIRIVLPLNIAGLATAAIFVFIFSWNEFIFSLILTGRSVSPGPTTVLRYVEMAKVYWGKMFACTTTFILPAIVLALLIHKSFVRGLTEGALKE